MKKILGLDLGTNSIGWALVNLDFEKKQGNIDGMGSRIIPMSQDIISDFGRGQSKSQTADRTGYRSARRLRQRTLLRRERLHRALHILGFLPDHYSSKIDFQNRKGQFIEGEEVKLPFFINGQGKHQFLFEDAFQEMLGDFQCHQPELVQSGKKIPYDWTIYYLRKKALSKKISKEELAWVLLNFNQKRGYYQLMGEEEVDDEKKQSKVRKEFISEVVERIEDTGQTYKENQVFEVFLHSGIKSKLYKREMPDWIGQEKDFVLTTDIDKEGHDKLDENGNISCKLYVPKEDDWDLLKAKAEKGIENHETSTVGAYIYDTLLRKPQQKIRGKLVRTIERKFYRGELEAILKEQVKYHDELKPGNEYYEKCINELYPNNEPHRNSLKNQNFINLFVKDIIFYQRPLKSKKSLISGCRFETRTYIDKEGKRQKIQVRGIPKSHPLFQEFRLWHFLSNLRIYQREKLVLDKLETNVDVTTEYLNREDSYTGLFEFLNTKADITQKQLLAHFKLKEEKFRWNYSEDSIHKANETRHALLAKLTKKKEYDYSAFLTKGKEEKLWHLLYSVPEPKGVRTGLSNLGVPEEAIENFMTFKPFKKDYGAYSHQALIKIVPLMRTGRFWSFEEIEPSIQNKINKICNGEFDEDIDIKTREKLQLEYDAPGKFKQMPSWLATYVAYNRHAEEGEVKKYRKPQDIQLLRQHELRNPIVEQVVNEALKVVRDIWDFYGKGEENFFEEIHVELGRDLKNPKNIREKISNSNSENQKTNQRIRAFLRELKNDGTIENVRPDSPNQAEILKIYEQGVLGSIKELPKDIEKISSNGEPTVNEIQRYKLWLDQKYISPYTGEPIPLSKLFTQDYEIEHVLPQSRFFDDSLNNKVICEAEVNSLKDNDTGYQFVMNHPGERVPLSNGKTVEVFKKEAYEDHVRSFFKHNRTKMGILLAEEIPQKFIERQKNDMRYISKVVKNKLSNIVREKDEQETTSKNLIPVTGRITSRLKSDWGLNDVWNRIVQPRFERINELTNSNLFGFYDKEAGFFRLQVPSEVRDKGFSTKRIDHRHHAMDALVVACATRNHVNYLSNQFANTKNKRIDLRNQLRHIEKWNDRTVAKNFIKPWDTFTQDSKNKLERVVVSFKSNLRVINKAVNYYQKWVRNENGVLENRNDNIQNGNPDWWSIRKPLHKETVSGKVYLNAVDTNINANFDLNNIELIVDPDLKDRIKKRLQSYDNKPQMAFDTKILKSNPIYYHGKAIKKIKCYQEYSATRVGLDGSFNSKMIGSVTDSGIRKILLNHLEKYDKIDDNGKIVEQPELAFSADGIEEMNRNIKVLNDGKPHQPIYKVRKYESFGNKFPVGSKGNKKDKYVEGAKGTNLYFIIYDKLDGTERLITNDSTLALKDVIDCQKAGQPIAERKEGYRWFSLSPNDLVFVPTEEERQNLSDIDWSNLSKGQVQRIYKFTDSSGSTANFVPYYVSDLIYGFPKKVAEKFYSDYGLDSKNLIQNELGVGSPQSKNQKALNGETMIKQCCVKLKVDRLGNISRADYDSDI